MPGSVTWPMHSGTRLHIAWGSYAATLTTVGASLGALRFDGRDLVVPTDGRQERPGYHGATLAPWPNRVVAARYRFAGTEYQLFPSEPEYSHAAHGLVAGVEFEVVRHSEHEVIFGARLEEALGYPWTLEIEVGYTLAADGLTQTLRARNLSASPAPFGGGTHPYLRAGFGPMSEWTLTVPADEVVPLSAEDLSPLAVRPVSGPLDLRRGSVIGAQSLDHSYTRLHRDANGMTAVTLTDRRGDGVAMSWDSRSSWVHVFTSDMPGDDLHRAGVAVEPMTCPPDAFNTGVDLLRIEPGDVARVQWRYSAIVQ